MVISYPRCAVGKERRHRIWELAKEHAALRGEFTLGSGLQSSYFFDMKMLTTLPEARYIIGEEIFEILGDAEIVAVGGLGIGGALMVGSVGLISDLKGYPLPTFVVRDDRKEHGTEKHIEGNLPRRRGARVAIVDDVITTGGSVSRAIERVENEGCKVVKVVVLLDRHQGGSNKLKREGYDFTAILHSDASGEVTVDEPSTVAGQVEGGAIPK